MDREPLIWRPNSVTHDEWESKSRDEKIAWWRANMRTTHTSTKRSMLEVPELFENGTLSLNECFFVICKRASHGDTPAFLNSCPAEILTMLREKLQDYKGVNPEDWPRSFSSATYAPWISAEEINESRKRDQQLLWNGIRILKSILKSVDNNRMNRSREAVGIGWSQDVASSIFPAPTPVVLRRTVGAVILNVIRLVLY